jgi:two-component system, NarL family, response regulator NreC
MTTAIRVLLADDHAILRAGLAMLINSQPDMQVVGEAADGPECVKRTAAVRPDVVVFDLTMPHTDVGKTIRELAGAKSASRVLVLTMHDDPAYVDLALAAGASGFVTKRAADPELLAAIRAVHSGRSFVDPAVERRSSPARGEGSAGQRRSRKGLLSKREAEVLKLLGAGHTNRAIAERLKLSVKTVETYRARLCEKLGLHDRSELVRYALQTGIVSADRLASQERG